MKHIIISTLLIAAASQAWADTRYIDDKMYVPMRAGDSRQHRITNKGLVSGTRVDVLGVNKETGFAHIRLDSGKEGYVPSQYLSKTPIAKHRLAEAKQTIEALTSKSQPLQKQLLDLRGGNKSLEQQVSTLTSEKDSIARRLAEIENISKNAVSTARKNKSLLKENATHKNTIDVLKADNNRLKQRSDQEWFLNGAGAVLLGVILALVIPRLIPKKKNAEWG